LRYIIFILIILSGTIGVSGQNDTISPKPDTLPGRIYLLQKVDRNGESLPEIEIKEVTVVGRQKGNARKVQSQLRKYDRLVYNLKRAYPYALIVRARLEMANEDLAGIPEEKDRRKYIKDLEKDVFAEYEDDMRRMTITQGRLLIKLIDRETQNTSYELIRQYRGGLSAAFWQGVARIFGTNLKEEYDPYGEDALIELIIINIEAGLL
jgi:hypothetical protein